jgi:hypothetical protein
VPYRCYPLGAFVAEIMLTDEDRKLMAHYQKWSQADMAAATMAATWFIAGVVVVFATGLVVLNAVNGATDLAVGFAVLGAIIAFATIRSTQRKLRLAQLIPPIKRVDPSANRIPTGPGEPSAAPDRSGMTA